MLVFYLLGVCIGLLICEEESDDRRNGDERRLNGIRVMLAFKIF